MKPFHNIIQVCVLAAPLLLTGVAVSQSHAKPEAARPPRLILAVKEVTAWPNLTLMRDGTFLATIFNQPSHGQVEGDVECWASRDGGMRWNLAGTPALHEPNSNRMNVAVGLAKNGDLLVISSGWWDKRQEGQDTLFDGPFRKAIAQPWVSRSKDGGKTWQINKTAFPLNAPDGGLLIPYGDIETAANGDLLAGAYSTKGPGETDRLYIYRSSDDGATWGSPVVMDEPSGCNETALFHMGGGQWLAAGRVNGKGLRLYASADDGKSWTFRKWIATGPRYPAHITRLHDNRILITFGNRSGSKGIDAIFSSDGGNIWTKPKRLAGFEGDGGYPASMQRPDGMVLTVFYAKKTQVYDGYQMAALVWDPAVPAQKDKKQ